MLRIAASWFCRILLAGVFLYSGYTKIQQDELQFAAAIARYRILPDRLALPVATYLPWLEILLGLLLVTAWKTRYVAGFTAALLSFFIVVLTITKLRGIEADCGCFGIGERISAYTIARDALFLIPAVFLVLDSWPRKAPAPDNSENPGASSVTGQAR